MIQNPKSILPQVAWSSIAGNVIKLTDWTYRLSVSPINITEPGAETADKQIGYYAVDFLGHLFSLIDVNGGDIDVNDDFETGVPPIVDRPIIIFKSVGDGRSQWLPPIRYEILDRSARSYLEDINLEVLWRNLPNLRKVPFANTATPGIYNWQDDQVDPEDNTKTINYQAIYEDDPHLRLVIIEDGNDKPFYQAPIIYKTAGKITHIEYYLGEMEFTGKILISKS